MANHLFLAPIQHLFEAVMQLKHCVVADSRKRVTKVLVFDVLKLDLVVKRIVADQLAFLDLHRIDLLVLTASDCKLFVSLHAENELCVCCACILVLERNKVVIAELRRRTQVKSLAEQST